MTTTPRCWVDDNHVTCFRSDVSLEEAQELDAIARQAFRQGLASGYAQGLARGHVQEENQ